MGEQLRMFKPDANEVLDAKLAQMRRERQARDDTRPRNPPQHRTVRATLCPSCGAHVTIEL